MPIMPIASRYLQTYFQVLLTAKVRAQSLSNRGGRHSLRENVDVFRMPVSGILKASVTR